MTRLLKICLWILAIHSSCIVCNHPEDILGAELDLGDLKTTRLLPRSEEEIAQAYERAKFTACEPVPPGEPLEITSFTPNLTERDRIELSRGMTLLPSSRRHMLTVGLEVSDSDKPRLPKVSGGRILQYLQDHYVTIQLRVQKEPVTGELFIHHRPLAATTTFGRGRLTESFTEPTLLAIQDFHSLGMLLPGDQPRTPKNLRTLVMIYRSLTVGPTLPTGKISLTPVYEWVFVRARESDNDDAGRLALHVFCTSDHRRKLHRLHAWEAPKKPTDCGIYASVVFTQYTTLGLIPSKSATRQVVYNSTAIFPWSTLDEFALARKWGGDALDNLQLTLDAIIDGKISPKPN